MATPDLHGAHVALVTPLTAQRRLHGPDLERLIRRVVDEGANGVLVGGTTGEGALLEPADRAELTRLARRTADGFEHPVAVLAGACGPTVAAVHADVATLADAGADAVLVLAPAIYPLTSDELVAFHLEIADRAAIPTLVYHLPQFTGSSLEPDAIGELAGHPRLVGMKDSSPDDDRRLAFVEVAAQHDGFDVWSGSAPSLYRTLAAGAAGSITAVANLRQRAVTALHDAVAAGDVAEADRRQAELAQLTDGLGQVGGGTPAVTKAALQLEGVIEERWCVAPLGSVAPARLDRVRTALLR